MIQNSIRSGCLFICYTPLHALIADKIVKQEKIGAYTVVYFYTTDNQKNKYYFDLIAANAQHAFYREKNNAVFHTLSLLQNLYSELKACLIKHPVIYSGNIKTIYSRFLVFRLRATTLHTFDDGIGNIREEGYFYEGRYPTAATRFLSVLGLDMSYSRMYRLIKKHYTIYKMPNAMPFCVYIELFDFKTSFLAENTQTTCVFLTSTLSEENVISMDLEKKLYKEIIDTFDVKYIIPHPLEFHQKITDAHVVFLKSDKIAEEMIMELRKTYGRIKVIGWYSSTLVHLMHVEGIETINIDFDPQASLAKTKSFLESHHVKSYTPKL